jgi:hypothetical protein
MTNPLDLLCLRARLAAILALLTAAVSPAAPSDDLLDDLLGDPTTPVSAAPKRADRNAKAVDEEADEAHSQLFLENKFPSATTCAKCHPQHFEEWSVSPHGYALISPNFNAFSAMFIKRLNGTAGDFCVRCHSQVAAQLGEPLFMPMLERHPASIEGITCIVCHRVGENYGRVSGRTHIIEGDVTDPVYGPNGNDVLEEILANKADYRVVTEKTAGGRAIHKEAIKFDLISGSGFCATCHDVPIPSGVRGQEVFSQYKNSPAADDGTTCQDCHMGLIPGIKSGYAQAPAAVIGGKNTPERKHTNHMFAGPDYSIVHPGIFPFNPKAQELASFYQWLDFDYEAGWGTDAFEDKVAADAVFPDRWRTIDDRYAAREIIQSQLALLDRMEEQRYQILRRGFRLRGFEVVRNDERGLRFKVEVRNATDGHSAPSGLDVHRLMFLEVRVFDADGHIVFQSGDRDPNGDVRDTLSSFVRNWEIPMDKQLFNLQSYNITTNQRGGDMPTILAVPQSPDPLPYFRPLPASALLFARAPVARKQTNTLPPLAARWADYTIPRKQLTRGPYTARIRFITQDVPVNFVNDIAGVGFDYNLSPREVARRTVEGAQILYDKTIELGAPGTTFDLSPTEAEIMAPPPKDKELTYPGLQFQHPGRSARSAPSDQAGASPASSATLQTASLR